ncbi:hypothetical protein RJ55_08666 [Drechmeria coniospora]|nr:hypothetical protein RJ55_08666 [Drechmeria coniospora]
MSAHDNLAGFLVHSFPASCRRGRSRVAAARGEANGSSVDGHAGAASFRPPCRALTTNSARPTDEHARWADGLHSPSSTFVHLAGRGIDAQREEWQAARRRDFFFDKVDRPLRLATWLENQARLTNDFSFCSSFFFGRAGCWARTRATMPRSIMGYFVGGQVDGRPWQVAKRCQVFFDSLAATIRASGDGQGDRREGPCRLPGFLACRGPGRRTMLCRPRRARTAPACTHRLGRGHEWTEPVSIFGEWHLARNGCVAEAPFISKPAESPCVVQAARGGETFFCEQGPGSPWNDASSPATVHDGARSTTTHHRAHGACILDGVGKAATLGEEHAARTCPLALPAKECVQNMWARNAWDRWDGPGRGDGACHGGLPPGVPRWSSGQGMDA